MAEMGTTEDVRQRIQRLNCGGEAERQQARKELIAVAAERMRELAARMLLGFPRVTESSGDLLSEAYVRLERALQDPGVQERLRTPADFYGLAALQIRRQLIDLARAADRHAAQLPPPAGGTSASGAQRAEPADPGAGPSTLARHAELYEAVSELPELERVALEMVWFSGLSKVEAAEVLGVDESTVRRRLLAAQEKLYDRFGGESPV
jgi:RNA polymerase sigma-70 factor (ECF subfamily)